MKAERYTWDHIRYELIETGWVDWESRPKTHKAAQRVVERMSEDELDLLTERVSIVFAPHPKTNGSTYPFDPSFQFVRLTQMQEAILSATELPPEVDDRPSEQVSRMMVYLSPKIESYSQKRVDSIVAHEFAHVLLHPWTIGNNPVKEGIEREADAKIQEWGFGPAYKEGEYPVFP